MAKKKTGTAEQTKMQEYCGKLETAIKEITCVENGEVKLKPEIQFSDLLTMKEAVAPINNLITMVLTEKFIDNLKDYTVGNTHITDEIIVEMKNKNSSRANANGYDFVYSEPDGLKIIAEVKANVPCVNDGMSYGGNQINGIKTDIVGLLKWKKSAKSQGVTEDDLNNHYYKFMVLLKTKGSEDAVKTLRNTLIDKDGSLSLFDGQEKRLDLENKLEILGVDDCQIDSTNNVYIVTIDI